MCYMVQMADFHFNGSGTGYEKDILTKMTEKIRAIIPSGETVVFCACGDYIDSSKVKTGRSKRDLTKDEVKARYKEAKETILSTVIDPLRSEYDLRIGLCVGNHDTTHMDEMNQLAKDIIGREISETYALWPPVGNLDFIFINSCPPNEHGYGKIDYGQLEKVLKDLRPDSDKYFILHHALMSMDEKDKSSLRQVPQLIKLIEKYSVKGVFHGHTHGQYMVRVGTESCPIVGVGAVFVREYPNVNSQFNLIHFKNGIAVSADNYQYHADWAMDPDSDGFKKFPIRMPTEYNSFYGKTFSQVYHDLDQKVRAESKLYHVYLNVRSSFSDFCSDVMENFGEKMELKTLDEEKSFSDKKYSYIELAEMWEDPQRNKEALYFNHGECFSTALYPSGIDYMLHELGEKRTSSRAVLVTVNTKQISETAPDALLPSLMSIQVGFDPGQTTLHIAMNLRALEVSRFLKINICEVLYVAKQIHEKFPFQDIEMSISAFRVQVIENLDCFLKAKLDTQAVYCRISHMLSSVIYKGVDPNVIDQKISKITSLIGDKKQRSETVIETIGIEHLLHAVSGARKELAEDMEALGPQLDQIHTCISELLNMLNEQKRNRAIRSEPTKGMDDLEDKITAQYDCLIREFEALKKA